MLALNLYLYYGAMNDLASITSVSVLHKTFNIFWKFAKRANPTKNIQVDKHKMSIISYNIIKKHNKERTLWNNIIFYLLT